MDCLQNIIGLTQKDCACFDADKPGNYADLNVSESGRYMTDEDFGVPLIEQIYASANCGDPALFEKMAEIRTNAIRNFTTALHAEINLVHEYNYTNYRGLIGKTDSRTARSVFRSKAGVQLRPQNIRGAFFMLTGFRAGFTTAGTIDVSIQSDDPEWTAQTTTINTVANTYVKTGLATPIRLPFYSTDCDNIRYTFSYDTTGLTPLGNSFYCCNLKPPYYASMSVGGFETDTIDFHRDYCNNAAYGLALEGYIACGDLDWLCELPDFGDYNGRDLVALCILCRSSVELITYMIQSGQTTSAKIKSKEALMGRRNMLQKKFKNDIRYIAENLPLKYSDCYRFKPAARMAG